MNKVYGIIFKDGHKPYYFKSSEEFTKGDYVIVDTEKGLQFGKVNITLGQKNGQENYKDILRRATEEDYNKYLKNLKDANNALKKCINLVKELNLKMNVINAQFTFERTQLLFNFTSDDRVDFRELAKKLASIYHTRIELRQIGARDKAKEIGGIGICGEQLCCVRFLTQLDTISINMAKDQNLALNPNKINGSCGRLLCCLAYENQNYLDNSKDMPHIGDTIITTSGESKVISVDILNRKYQVINNGNKEEFYLDEDSEK